LRCVVSRIRLARGIGHHGKTVNAELIGGSYASAVEAADSMRKSMDAQRIAIDAVVALTNCAASR
jgi:hypothetical protein